VKLSYFQKDFAAEMNRLHGGDAVFEKWTSSFGKGILWLRRPL